MIPITVGREFNGRWWADIESMPGVMAYGESRELAITNVRILALRVSADCLEFGEDLPGPLNQIFAVREPLYPSVASEASLDS